MIGRLPSGRKPSLRVESLSALHYWTLPSRTIATIPSRHSGDSFPSEPSRRRNSPAALRAEPHTGFTLTEFSYPRPIAL